MALNFRCIEYATVSCSYDVTGGTGSYDEALAAFASCENTAQPDGYCSASISSAEFLSNQHVCEGKPARHNLPDNSTQQALIGARDRTA